MTKIIGQIESLKRIRNNLTENGITDINSVKEIFDYLSSYKEKEQQVLKETENDLNLEIKNLKNKLTLKQEEFNQSKNKISENLSSQISTLKDRAESLQSAKPKFLLSNFINKFQLKKTDYKRKKLEKYFDNIIEKRTRIISSNVEEINNEIENLTLNKERHISERSRPKISNILLTKEVLKRLNPLIAGAIGENLVVKELEKLPDDFILFNDFSLNFNPPIYNRNNNDRIFSIQIDHLLITHSGIFILETKNWSKESIKNLDLRSPVQQIQRTNFALFVILSSASEYNYLGLNNHHWGEKQIPIRNVVVMINEKPNEEFKFVKIKKLNELNNYINYFEPIFTQSEIKRIAEYLKSINN